MRRKTEESGTTSTACRNGTDKDTTDRFYRHIKMFLLILRR